MIAVKRRQMKSKPKIAKTIKAKTPHNTTSDNKGTKTVTPWIEDYLNVRSMRMHPVTETFIDDLAQQLIAWVIDDDQKRFKQPLMLSQFYLSKGIQKMTFHRWMERFPQLKHASEFAKEVIANRREVGAMIKEYDFGAISFMQPHYSPEWKEQLDYRAAQKLAAQGAQGNVLVQITSFPETDVKRIEDKE